MALHSIRLPDQVTRELDALAARRKTNRSTLIREAVERYCAAMRAGERGDRLALLERLVTYEGSRVGDLAERSEHYLREMFGGKRRRGSR